MVKPVEERIVMLRNQLEEWTKKTLDEIQKKDQFPGNMNLIVQYASAVYQYADVLDREEKKSRGVPVSE
jgi:hypothetical protein